MTDNVQTTKSADYGETPHKITAVIQAATLDPRFNDALVDMTSKRQVWKGQADFNIGDFMDSFHESNPSQRWADDLSGLMLKDKIFTACNFNRKRA